MDADGEFPTGHGQAGEIYRLHAWDHGIAARSIGAVHYYSAPQAERSGWREYREQVRAIAPAELVGRGAELAGLQAFCDSPDPYWCGQAGPWAGKTALMSWFVLHPPPDVVPVSFFVTARYASQDDSTAFMTTALGQMEELLRDDQPHPAASGLAGRYRLALSATARHLQAQGKRLVLVVDGLDEDRGAVAKLPSIASLLPRYCEHGLKVITASRPHPEVPGDVPSDHPLRNRAYLRVISMSRYAAVIRDTAESELRALLSGTSAHQDILGLVCAAVGGLTVRGLSELTGQAPFEIRQVVSGVTGRTFVSRSVAGERPGDAELAYLLAHESLQAETIGALGAQRMSAYRYRLRRWADSYRLRRWPTDTPEYLLRGYFRMLQAAGDSARLIACASDPARHDRLLAASGGDALALAEIAVGIGEIVKQPVADLADLARLAFYRDILTDRNDWIPERLPAVWAVLGQFDRAEALALSKRRWDAGWAVTAVVGALATAGELDRAEALARSISDRYARAWALVAVAGALEAAALQGRARQAADEAEKAAKALHGGPREQSLAAAAEALAATGQYDRAEALARSLSEYNHYNAQAAGAVAALLAAAGLADRAEALAQTIDAPVEGARALAGVAAQLAGAGYKRRAGRIAAEAEILAHSEPDPAARAGVLADLAGMLMTVGRTEHADKLASQAEIALATTDDWDMGRGSSGAASEYRIGLDPLIGQMAGHAEATARLMLTHGHSLEFAPRRTTVAKTLARSGLYRQASTVTASIMNPYERAHALAVLAQALADDGQHDQAKAQAELAANAAAQVLFTSKTAGNQPEWKLSLQNHRELELAVHTAKALLAARLDDRAVQAWARASELAQSIGEPDALSFLGQALAVAGQYDQAAQIVDQAETLARRAVGVGAETLGQLAEALIGVRLHGQALQAARRAAAAALSRRADFLTVRDLNAATRALASAGAFGEAAHTAAAAAEAAADEIDAYHAAKAMLEAAEALTTARQPQQGARIRDQAEALARSAHPARYAEALASQARALAAAGAHDRARRIAAEAEADLRLNAASYRSLGSNYSLIVMAVAKALASAGSPEQAQALASTITDPMYINELTGLAQVLAAAGAHRQARQVTTQAEGLAHADTVPWYLASGLALVAVALAANGDHRRAQLLAIEAETINRSNGNSDRYPSWATVEVVRALVATGLHDHAEALAQSITVPAGIAAALTAVAQAPRTPHSERRWRHMIAMALATVRCTDLIPLLPQEPLQVIATLIMDTYPQ